jgi:hypothetical protein
MKFIDIQKALKICAMATNPASANPMAHLVKLDDGFMSAYGGLCCIRVPVGVEVGAAFNPGQLGNFFRKERKAPAFSLKGGKLHVKEGNERLSVGMFPPEDLATIDVLSDAAPVEFPIDYLRHALLFTVPDRDPWASGVTFRDDCMWTSDRKSAYAASCPLFENEEFAIHRDAATLLTKMPGKVIGFARFAKLVKFEFDSGVSLTTHEMIDVVPETVAQFFGLDFSPIGFDNDVAKEITKVRADHVYFQNGSLAYKLENQGEGCFEKAYTSKMNFSLDKDYLDRLLAISPDLEVCQGAIRSSFGEECGVTTVWGEGQHP